MRIEEHDREREAVIAVATSEMNAAAEGDIVSYLSLLSDDAVFMAPATPRKTGQDLRKWLSDFLEDFEVQWVEYLHGETEVQGSLAFHDYTYTRRITPKGGGETVESRGKGLHVLRRDPSGRWQVLREIWNDSPEKE
jgi:ketosteroid isomerase-like protein